MKTLVIFGVSFPGGNDGSTPWGTKHFESEELAQRYASIPNGPWKREGTCSALRLEVCETWEDVTGVTEDEYVRKVREEALGKLSTEEKWALGIVELDQKRCPKCGHGWHVNPCLNTASDNDCNCFSSLPQTAEEKSKAAVAAGFTPDPCTNCGAFTLVQECVRPDETRCSTCGDFKYNGG